MTESLHIATEPHFVDFPEGAEEIVGILEEGIRSNSELYSKALDVYAAVFTEDFFGAISLVAEHVQQHPEDAQSLPNAYSHWIKFLRPGYDRESSFDESTEAALTVDAQLAEIKNDTALSSTERALKTRMQRIRSFIGRVSLMQAAEQNAGPEAEPITQEQISA